MPFDNAGPLIEEDPRTLYKIANMLQQELHRTTILANQVRAKAQHAYTVSATLATLGKEQAYRARNNGRMWTVKATDQELNGMIVARIAELKEATAQYYSADQDYNTQATTLERRSEQFFDEYFPHHLIS